MKNRRYTHDELNQMTRIQLSYESTDGDVLQGINTGFLIFAAGSKNLFEKIHVSLPPAIDVYIIRLTYLDQDLMDEEKEREVLVRIAELFNDFLTDKKYKHSLTFLDTPVVLPDANEYDFSLHHLHNGI